jgi:general secretion pathway protein J
MSYRDHKNIVAFTLFEVLIALVIFAILGLIVAIGFRRTLESNQRANDADKRIQKIEVAQALLRRDIMAIVDRPITDRDGQKLPAVLLKSNEIDFTRGGAVNPFYISHRSDLQRIEYAYNNNSIVRTIWPTLDRMSGTTPASMTLLSNVTNFTIQVYDNNNTLQNAWPFNSNSNAILSSSNQQTDLPRGIRITFTLKGQGSIEDIISIPSRGLMSQDDEKPNPPKS